MFRLVDPSTSTLELSFLQVGTASERQSDDGVQRIGAVSVDAT